ncbi:MAG: hypothetical protein ACYSTL_00410 [Planctomycetota bacterium]|jgi:hypothetical protein
MPRRLRVSDTIDIGVSPSSEGCGKYVSDAPLVLVGKKLRKIPPRARALRVKVRPRVFSVQPLIAAAIRLYKENSNPIERVTLRPTITLKA